MTKLPSLFIGSSVEGLRTAYAIQQALEYDAEPTVWSQGIFQPTQSVFSDLVDCLSKFDFAVFVFSPDDTVKLRGTDVLSIRDNVIFELGLFIGALGSGNCFYLVPRDTPNLHLPTDLAGLTPLTYNASRSDGNLLAALGPACNMIRQALIGHLHAPKPIRTEAEHHKLDRFLSIWNGSSMTKDRDLVNKDGIPMSSYEVDLDNQAVWDAFKRIFYFLESLSASILSNDLDENETKRIFGTVLPSVWKHGRLALAPLNGADEAWIPLPHIATVAAKWS